MVLTFLIPIGTILVIGSIIITFWFPFIGWILLSLPAIFLIVYLFFLKQSKWPEIEGLSTTAKQLYKTATHFYHAPYACATLSVSASYIYFAGILLGIIDFFKQFYLGVIFAIINFIVMHYVAATYNPTAFLNPKYPELKIAHKEILSHF